MSSPSPHPRTGLVARPAAAAERAGSPDPGALYTDNVQAVARWATRLVGPGTDVEDIVHEVFLVAFRKMGEFRGEAKLTTWLYEITVRIVQDRRRKQRRWRWWSGSGGAGEGGLGGGGGVADEMARLATDQPSALELLERKEASAVLYAVLDGLSDKYRTAIILFELEGLSGQEIAAITGTSLSNVWIRLMRGREQFLKRLTARQARQDSERGKKQETKQDKKLGMKGQSP